MLQREVRVFSKVMIPRPQKGQTLRLVGAAWKGGGLWCEGG